MPGGGKHTMDILWWIATWATTSIIQLAYLLLSSFQDIGWMWSLHVWIPLTFLSIEKSGTLVNITVLLTGEKKDHIINRNLKGLVMREPLHYISILHKNFFLTCSVSYYSSPPLGGEGIYLTAEGFNPTLWNNVQRIMNTLWMKLAIQVHVTILICMQHCCFNTFCQLSEGPKLSI